MKTAIIYASHHGTTEKVANMIKGLAQGETEVINLKKTKTIDLNKYDKIIIGGSIHAGRVQSKLQKYCREHEAELTAKPLGLFLSCMEENEKAKTQFEMAYPDTLRSHAISSKLTGGEILFERMNFIEKFIMKKIGKTTETVSKIKEDQIRELAVEMGLLN